MVMGRLLRVRTKAVLVTYHVFRVWTEQAPLQDLESTYEAFERFTEQEAHHAASSLCNDWCAPRIRSFCNIATATASLYITVLNKDRPGHVQSNL